MEHVKNEHRELHFASQANCRPWLVKSEKEVDNSQPIFNDHARWYSFTLYIKDTLLNNIRWVLELQDYSVVSLLYIILFFIFTVCFDLLAIINREMRSDRCHFMSRVH